MDDLNKQIKKLAGTMEVNALLDYELDGYFDGKSSEHRQMWRDYGKHHVHQKKKLAYIDHGTGGKLLVQTSEESKKEKGTYPKGSVFSIKAYGKKNRYLGDVKKVLAQEKARMENLKGLVFERSLKRRKK